MSINIPKQNRNILKLLSIGFLLLLLFSILAYWFGLRINFSKSYPIGIYKTIHKQSIEKGDLVIFCPKNSPLIQKALQRNYLKPGFCKGGFYPLLKKVVALEGDIVEINSSVYINNREVPNSQLLTHDGNNNPLPSLKNSRIKLPKSYMFVMSDYYHKSFDSRYFGSVEVSSVLSHVEPIYIFQN